MKTSYNNKLQCFICFNDEIALELFDVTVCKTYLYILRNDGCSNVGPMTLKGKCEGDQLWSKTLISTKKII